MRRRLGWEIATVLAAKLVLLTALFLFFFDQPVAPGGAAVGLRIFRGD